MTAAAIRRLRKRLGLSRLELANRLGVTQQAVGLWERGKRKPGGSTVKLLEAMAKS